MVLLLGGVAGVVLFVGVVLFAPAVGRVPFVGVYKPQYWVKPRAQALSAPFPGRLRQHRP